jgi:signal transduction histidine kinase
MQALLTCFAESFTSTVYLLLAAKPIRVVDLLADTVVWNLWPICVITLFGGVGAFYVAKNWRREQELKLEQVRSRIATDLHDDIGSSLSQVAIMCEVLSRQSLNERETLQEIAGVSRNVLASMSEIVWAVDPSHDHLCDLTQRMRWFAGETLSGRDVALEFSASEASREVRLESEIRRQIFLIFKECVNNIVRHASATHARVRLQVADNHLALMVEDDGRGFDPKSVFQGNGLRNIRHRTRLLRGRLETRSGLGQGTVVVLRVPLSECAKGRLFPTTAHKRAV